MLDLQKLARAVSISASDWQSGVRKHCQLRDAFKMLQLFTALRSGCSRARAAKVAGISEATLRLWLQEAKRQGEDSVYGQFKTCLEAVEDERRPKPPPVPVAVPARADDVVAPAPPVTLRAVPKAAPRPTMTPEDAARIHAELNRLQQALGGGLTDLATPWQLREHEQRQAEIRKRLAELRQQLMAYAS